MRQVEEDRATNSLFQEKSCPVPEYQHDIAIERVAERYCSGDFERAEAMLHQRPAKFNRLLTWIKVDDKAIPLRDERLMKEKSKK